MKKINKKTKKQANSVSWEKKDCTFNPRLKKRLNLISTFIVIFSIGVSLFGVFNYNFIKSEISEDILIYGEIGLFLSAVFLELVPQYLNPYFIILASISSGMNGYLAIILGILGSAAGSILGFELGKKYGFRLLCPLFDQKTLKKMIDFWNKRGKLIVLISALTPIPYLPILFGALNMERKEFWIWGLIPRAASFIVIGLAYYWGFYG